MLCPFAFVRWVPVLWLVIVQFYRSRLSSVLAGCLFYMLLAEIVVQYSYTSYRLFYLDFSN